MKTFSNTSPNRGSALLIVLGLLSFLMISAVAFSISMRTERSAAAAYRRNVQARELLTTAFADARANVELALNSQRNEGGTSFDRNVASTRTVEKLAPFKYPNADAYGRIITSRYGDSLDATDASSADEEPIAYILDDAMMRHVPPYVADTVYNTLERQKPTRPSAATSELGYGNYYIDWTAGWKPIIAEIPERDIEVNGKRVSGVNGGTAVIGRMAWAVVNLSDSLDINAIGSVSPYRGIGLTGSELAFGQPLSSTTDDYYDLFNTAKDIKTLKSSSKVDLPIFCSNADLAQYASRVKDSASGSIVVDNGNEAPFSWEDTLANTKNNVFFSPFSVYGFWPNADRKKENGARAASDSSQDVISCNEVSESAISQGATGLGDKLAKLANTKLGESGDAGFNFVRMLHDYIDANHEPDIFDTGAVADLYNNAQPTVESVPMLCELGYNATGWEAKPFEKIIQELIDRGIYPDGKQDTVYESVDDIPDTLGDQTLKLTLPDLSQQISLRGYFPGASESDKTYTFIPEGFVGVCASTTVSGSTDVKMEKSTLTSQLKRDATGSILEMEGGAAEVFKGVSGITLKNAESMTLEVKGSDIPVGNDKKSSQPEPKAIAINLLVDFFVRVSVEGDGAVVDMCPTDRGQGMKRTKADYPSSTTSRVDASAMGKIDSQFFRITRPVSITFSLKWNVEEKETNEGKRRYTAKAVLADKPKLSAESNWTTEFLLTKQGGSERKLQPASKKTDASYLALSEESGTWFTIDPRYNWISPMLGCKDETPEGSYLASGYGAQPKFSSPHWIFIPGAEITSGNSSPSDVQTSYAKAHSDIVPFSWGLEVQDIRYGYNDAGQLFMPAEVAFLPVPCATSTWHPYQRDYLMYTFSSYHESVAKMSFFRSLPVVDLKDGAMSYSKFVPLASMLSGFGGDNFPEEHRGIVNVFAGQDNYLLCQRLRQLALLGTPSTIREAAYVTYQRLQAASTVSRVPKDMLSDLDALKTLPAPTEIKPKYDTFITQYLFPLPKTSGGESANARDWSKEKELYKGKSGKPSRPQTLDFIVQEGSTDGDSFVDRLKAYNDAQASTQKLGQNDMTTLLALSRECFGDRQQLFLYLLRADFIAYHSARTLASHKPLSTARAVALVWRDAYGELPDRVVYFQFLP